MTTSLKEVLLAEYKANRDQLTAQQLVNAARSPEHPLHNRFEWDDTVAAEKYRLEQARHLIRAVRHVEVAEDKPTGKASEPVRAVRVKAFHAMPKADGPSYVPISEIREDPFQSEMLIRRAEREWRAMLARYGHLKEFLNLVRESLDGAA